MADTSAKIAAILRLVEEGSYFTINRPRQYGKTTLAHILSQQLRKTDQFLLLEMSFEGIGDIIFEEEQRFSQFFVEMLEKELRFAGENELAALLEKKIPLLQSLKDLSEAISVLNQHANKQLVLSIDEIDKSSNNQLFLSFLGMLREKYLQAMKQRDFTFQSVILIGVHDIKSLKLKFPSNAAGKLNSPWNIAIDFNVDMSFNQEEIAYMLEAYAVERKVKMETGEIAEKIYAYTSGYPYLVSKLCKVIDEQLLPEGELLWDSALVETAFRYLVDEGYSTTLFDDMVKNLENNPELYDLVFDISFNGNQPRFNLLDPLINQGVLYGILRQDQGRCIIHNRIFEQKIYDYILSKHTRKTDPHAGSLTSRFYTDEGLDLPAILLGFQEFMREHYSSKDAAFLEREGRLLFLSYLKPIINGQGFTFKEPNVAAERRMDIVITYKHQRYVLELKRWEGDAYHQKGLLQLSGYLDTVSMKDGYLLIFDFRKTKTQQQEWISVHDKQIFAVWV